MRIGVDIDDVLVPTMKTLIIWHNRIFGTKFVLDDVKYYQLWKLFGGDRNCILQKMSKYVISNEFLSMIPDNYTIQALECLAENNDLYLITSRKDYARDFTVGWVEKNFGDIFEKLYFTDHCVDESNYVRKKSDVCRDLQIDIMIEDCLEYALECAPVVRMVYLMDKPWNQYNSPNNSPMDNIQRIKGDWRDLNCSICDFLKK